MPHCQMMLRSLRSQGFRVTPQREMIVEVVAHSGDHLSAEQIFARVRQRASAVNLATVYRTLDFLVGLGYVSRLNLGEGEVVYATLYHGPHIHLVCRVCGGIADADQGLLETLQAQLIERYQFTPDLQHISLAGLCEHCQPVPAPAIEGEGGG